MNSVIVCEAVCLRPTSYTLHPLFYDIKYGTKRLRHMGDLIIIQDMTLCIVENFQMSLEGKVQQRKQKL